MGCRGMLSRYKWITGVSEIWLPLILGGRSLQVLEPPKLLLSYCQPEAAASIYLREPCNGIMFYMHQEEKRAEEHYFR